MNSNTPPSNCKIDVHCHLFNKNVLTWRLMVDFVQSRRKLLFLATTDGADGLSGKINKLKGALNFLKIGLKPSSEEVYKTLISAEKDYAVVPLMFDLDYCMKGGQGEENAALQEEIVAEFNEILYNDREELSRMKMDANYFANANGNGGNGDIDENEIDELLQTIDLLLGSDSDALVFSDKENAFLNQERQLVELKKRYPDKVFPFYAVDTRRKENYSFENGMFNLDPILQRLAINGGHFQEVFTSSELKAIMEYNPRRFLSFK